MSEFTHLTLNAVFVSLRSVLVTDYGTLYLTLHQSHDQCEGVLLPDSASNAVAIQ